AGGTPACRSSGRLSGRQGTREQRARAAGAHLAPEDVDAVLVAAEGDDERLKRSFAAPLLALLAGTGLRLGEALGAAPGPGGPRPRGGRGARAPLGRSRPRRRRELPVRPAEDALEPTRRPPRPNGRSTDTATPAGLRAPGGGCARLRRRARRPPDSRTAPQGLPTCGQGGGHRRTAAEAA